MDAVCVSRAAGRTAGDSTGTIRSSADRWFESLANVLARDADVAEACDPDRSPPAHDGFATCVRSDIYSDGRWAGIRDRDDQSLHLSHGVSVFLLWLCGGDVVCVARADKRDQCCLHQVSASERDNLDWATR